MSMFRPKSSMLAGIMKRNVDQFESLPQVCPDESGKPLGFKNCISAFIVMIFGMSLAMVLLCIENLYKLSGWPLPEIFKEQPMEVQLSQDFERLPPFWKNFILDQNQSIAELTFKNDILKRNSRDQMHLGQSHGLEVTKY